MKTYKIEIAVDTERAEDFAAWLNAQGHDAHVGTSTGDYIDGEWTSADEQANEIMQDLWDGYCKQ